MNREQHKIHKNNNKNNVYAMEETHNKWKECVSEKMKNTFIIKQNIDKKRWKFWKQKSKTKPKPKLLFKVKQTTRIFIVLVNIINIITTKNSLLQ